MHLLKHVLVKYYRLSLEDDDITESGSISNQRKLVEDFISKDANLQAMESLELVDDGYTGSNTNRPGFQKVMELLRKNQVACIIVKDFSRFTRDYLELGDYLEKVFPFMQVRFISINDNYDSSAMLSSNGIEIPFKGLLNDLYSKDVSVKVTAGKRQLIKAGKKCSGSCPFGYRKDESGQYQYQIDELAAEIVRSIFDLAVSGMQNIEIAKYLNDRNVPTPAMYRRLNGGSSHGLKKGQKAIWDSMKVLSVLRNEHYKGTLILGRYRSGGVGSGRIVEAAREEWYYQEHAIPTIIRPEIFDQVQELRPYRKRGAYNTNHHVLYRKVKCGCCGRYLYFKPSDHGEQYNSFYCKQSHLVSASKCFTGYIKEKDIKEAVLRVICQHVAVFEDGEAAAKKNPAGKSPKQQLELIKKRQEVLRSQKMETYERYREGDISKAEFLAKKAARESEEQRLLEEIAVVQNRIEVREENTYIRKLICSGKIECLDREMVDEMVEMIFVYDVDRVRVKLRYGVEESG